MKITSVRTLVAAGALALCAGLVHAQEAARDVAKEALAFGNWRLSCKTQPNVADEVCELFQPLLNLLGKDPQDPNKMRAQLLATVGVFKLPNSDRAQMVVKAPLGSRLHAPVLRIPGHKDVQLPFLYCDASGCPTVPVLLDKAFVDAVKAAEAVESTPEKPQGALVLVLQVTRPEKGSQFEAVTVNFPLKGFGQGYETLLTKSKEIEAKKT